MRMSPLVLSPWNQLDEEAERSRELTAELERRERERVAAEQSLSLADELGSLADEVLFHVPCSYVLVDFFLRT